jgi:hypothetical protein
MLFKPSMVELARNCLTSERRRGAVFGIIL